MTSLRACRALLAGLLCASATSWAQAEPEAEPFQTRNLSPLVAIFGQPTWSVPSDVQRLLLTTEVANNYRLSLRGTDLLILDGEGWRNSLSYERSFGEGWSIGIELPFFRYSGGVLDNVVDAWHSFFNMPDGGRNNRPQDELFFQLGNQNGVFFELDEDSSSIGDAQLEFSYRLGREQRFVAKATLKLPTGDEQVLAGSGSADLSVTLLASRPVTLGQRPAGYFWGVGVMRVGDADLIEFEQRDTVLLGILGGSLRVLPRFGLKAQIDVHSPFYRTELEEIGQASVQATIGGWWQASERAVLDFAVNEDLHVSTAPDVVLHLGLEWRW